MRIAGKKSATLYHMNPFCHDLAMNLILGQIFALLTAVGWAQNSLIYSYLGKRTGSDTVTHIRLWLALPIIFIINYIITGTFFPADISLHSIILIFLSGFFGFFIADLFLFRAFVLAGAREALVIMTTSPLFALLFSWFYLRETLTFIQISGIVIILLGVVMVIWEENRGKEAANSHVIKGFLFALLAAFTQALGLIFAKKAMMAGVHPVSTNMIRIMAGLTGMAFYSLIKKQFISDFRKMNTPKDLQLLLFAVIAGPVMGIILSLYALNMAPVGIVTALMQVSPVMLLPVEIFWMKKKVGIKAVTGTVMAVAGAALLFTF